MDLKGNPQCDRRRERSQKQIADCWRARRFGGDCRRGTWTRPRTCRTAIGSAGGKGESAWRWTSQRGSGTGATARVAPRHSAASTILVSNAGLQIVNSDRDLFFSELEEMLAIPVERRVSDDQGGAEYISDKRGGNRHLLGSVHSHEARR